MLYKRTKKQSDFHQNQDVINAISSIFNLFDDKKETNLLLKQVCPFLADMNTLVPDIFIYYIILDEAWQAYDEDDVYDDEEFEEADEEQEKLWESSDMGLEAFD